MRKWYLSFLLTYTPTASSEAPTLSIQQPDTHSKSQTQLAERFWTFYHAYRSNSYPHFEQSRNTLYRRVVWTGLQPSFSFRQKKNTIVSSNRDARAWKFFVTFFWCGINDLEFVIIKYVIADILAWLQEQDVLDATILTWFKYFNFDVHEVSPVTANGICLFYFAYKNNNGTLCMSWLKVARRSLFLGTVPAYKLWSPIVKRPQNVPKIPQLGTKIFKITNDLTKLQIFPMKRRLS